MSKQMENSLFMFSPSVTRHAEVYQQLLRGLGSYRQLGNNLIRLGEQAHAFRQFDKVREIGQLLSNIPFEHYQAIGHYFLAVAANSRGNGDQEEARRLFELAVDTAPEQYKAKALLSLAAVSKHAKDYHSQFRYLLETAKVSRDISTTVRAHLGVAIYKGVEGFHRESLKDLESLYPVARLSQPIVFFDYLNSLAVELGEAGRKYEARNIIKHVIASPFAFAYPEWQDTASDLKESNRSFVTVPSIQRQPAEPKHVETPKPVIKPKQPASVLTFPKLKEAPLPEKPERLTPQQYLGLSSEEKREMFFAALKTGAIREDDYYKMMVMLGLLKSGPADEILDLEDDKVLDDIACVWSAQIRAEVFAGFLSALRDCDDSFRRNDIFDRLLTKVFHESQICGITEEEWRLQVERRLPVK